MTITKSVQFYTLFFFGILCLGSKFWFFEENGLILGQSAAYPQLFVYSNHYIFIFIFMRNYKEIPLLKVGLKFFTFRPYEFENLAGLRGGQKINGTYLDWYLDYKKSNLGKSLGTRVSVQGVKSLGGHFACLCPGFEFYEVKKKIFVIIFQKENGNTFTLFIIFIVKSLQNEQNSTNLPE